MTLIYDRRKINNQMLLIQFNFNSYGANSFSLDKYISVDVWSQIYKKIEPTLESCHSKSVDSLNDETFILSRAQLELNLEWKRLRSLQKEIIKQFSGKNCDDLCANYVIVKVGMISALDKFNKLSRPEKKCKKKTPTDDSIASEPNKPAAADAAAAADGAAASAVPAENFTLNGSTSPAIEEYIPEPLTEILSSLKYTPFTLSNSIENVVGSSADEYDPLLPSLKNGGDESDGITYTPKKIAHTTAKTTMLKTDLNRNDCTDKKTRMHEIFGGDSGDDNDLAGNKKSRRLYSSSKTPPNETDKPKYLQKNLERWVNQNRPKRLDTKKDCDRSDDKRKVRKIASKESLECDNKEMDENEKLRKLRESFEAMEECAKVDRNIDLKDMKVDHIINTFPKHQAALRAIFQKHSKIPDCRFHPTYDECPFLLILDGLLNQAQQTEMYQKIRSEFCDPDTTDDITSKHENLFWERIIPEWGLQIFMDTFSLNRTNAIKRLEEQERAKNAETYHFDLDN